MHSEPGPSISFREGWGNIDATPDPDRYLRLLDLLRPRHADTPEYRRFAAMLRLQEGDHILDVGCGSGGGVRAMAELVGHEGRVVGVDRSTTMIAEARRRSEGLALPVEYVVADAHALPFAENTFMGCYADGLFDTVADPERALAEMIRVVQPGGHVAAWALDSLIVDADDRALTRRIVDYICDHQVNGWLGRRFPRMFKDLGLTEVALAPITEVHSVFDSVYELWLRAFVDQATEAGVVTSAEAGAWCAELLQRSRAGKLLIAWSFFWVTGQKPW